MVMMDNSVDSVLAQFSGPKFADTLGATVVSEWDYVLDFNRLIVNGHQDSKDVKLHDEFMAKATSEKPLREWRRAFRRHGFRAVRGDTTVMTEPPEYPMLLWRLANDWRVGLSWASDAKFCHSRPVMTGHAKSTVLWASIVPPDALLGINWGRAAARAGGRPLWRTVEHEAHGRFIVAVDDCAEVFVDGTKLVQADSLGVGRVTDIYGFEGYDSYGGCGHGFGGGAVRSALLAGSA